MTNPAVALCLRFTNLMAGITRLLYMTRAKELQVEACRTVEALETEASRCREDAIRVRNEEAANLALSVELMSRAVLEELRMWVALKEDDPNRAWDHLIQAQRSTLAALRACPPDYKLRVDPARLEALESLLFPPQQFISIGMVVSQSRCSICGQDYGECSHIKGRAYLGRLCVEVIEQADIQEASLVDKPGDKRCRFTAVTNGGTKRDIMTWRVVSDDEQGGAR